MNSRMIETGRGAKVHVLEAGSGQPLVFMHGAGGLFPENPFLDQLAQHYQVFAPEFPGFGESSGEELLEDMLDFSLHGWDVVHELGLSRPHLVGHSMGGMIAAEMAALAPNDVAQLVLVASAGLWLAEHPIPDIFSFLPHEFAQYLFHDRSQGEAMLTGGLDLKNPEALKEFYIGNSRRLSMAGKILSRFPTGGFQNACTASARRRCSSGARVTPSSLRSTPSDSRRSLPTPRLLKSTKPDICCRTNSRKNLFGQSRPFYSKRHGRYARAHLPIHTPRPLRPRLSSTGLKWYGGKRTVTIEGGSPCRFRA